MAEFANDFTVRLATAAEAGILAWQRARMWQDMGEVPPDLFAPLRDKSETYLHEALARGDYFGWLASPAASPDSIIAGAGVHLRRAMPHPLTSASKGTRVADALYGTILNVFTEPEWRRRGVAGLLMRCIIDWARERDLDGLTLHASPAARALYEKLGFVATREMRLLEL